MGGGPAAARRGFRGGARAARAAGPAAAARGRPAGPRPQRRRPGGGFGAAGGGGGGTFGGDSSSLTSAVAYIKAHGGGTIGVSSQRPRPRRSSTSDANVAGLGGFSGRESEVDVTWLAQEVRDGNIRWISPNGGRGIGNDGRAGSDAVMRRSRTSARRSPSTDHALRPQGKADALQSAG